jgi:hypothetical protein
LVSIDAPPALASTTDEDKFVSLVHAGQLPSTGLMQLPQRIRVLSAVITRPVLEGDHVEYEIETQYTLRCDTGGYRGAAAADWAAEDGDTEAFIECARFDGPYDGYEFKTGQEGVGYYRIADSTGMGEPAYQLGVEGAGAGADGEGQLESAEAAEVHLQIVQRRFSKFDTLRKLIVKTFPELPKLPKKGFRRHGGVGEVALAEYTASDQTDRMGRIRSRSVSATAESAAAVHGDPRMGGLNVFLAALVAMDGSSDDLLVQQFLGVSELDRMTLTLSLAGVDAHQGHQGGAADAAPAAADE